MIETGTKNHPFQYRKGAATKPPSKSDEDNLSFFSRVLRFDASSVGDDGEILVLCPFHKDSDPSFSLNVRSGLWNCKAGSCGRSGNRTRFEELLKDGPGLPKIEISEDLVRDHHEILLRSKGKVLEYITETRGISVEAIKRFRLGFDADRIWIPVYLDGKPSNVRRFAVPWRAKVRFKVLNLKGKGEVAVYPEEVLKADEKSSGPFLLCEGEWDALVANDRGIPAITFTGGADSVPVKERLEILRGKDIVIAYDCDPAGKRGALKAANRIFSIAKSVRILDLDIPKQGADVSDWFLKENKTVEELRVLMEKAEIFIPKAASKRDISDEEIDVHLADSGKSKLAYKRVRLTFHVAGKDLSPYIIPKKVKFECEGGTRACAGCRLYHQGLEMETTFGEENPDELIEMVGHTRATMDRIIRKMAGIPLHCPKPNIETTEFQNIERLRAIPNLDFTYDGRSYTLREVYRIGVGTETNRPYKAVGIVLPDPESQNATILFYDFKETEDSLDQFRVTPEFIEAQKIFRVIPE